MPSSRAADRRDSEPLTPAGQPLSSRDLLALAEITPQDLSAALDRFRAAVPRRYQRLLD